MRRTHRIPNPEEMSDESSTEEKLMHELHLLENRFRMSKNANVKFVKYCELYLCFDTFILQPDELPLEIPASDEPFDYVSRLCIATKVKEIAPVCYKVYYLYDMAYDIMLKLDTLEYDIKPTFQKLTTKELVQLNTSQRAMLEKAVRVLLGISTRRILLQELRQKMMELIKQFDSMLFNNSSAERLDVSSSPKKQPKYWPLQINSFKADERYLLMLLEWLKAIDISSTSTSSGCLNDKKLSYAAVCKLSVEHCTKLNKKPSIQQTEVHQAHNSKPKTGKKPNIEQKEAHVVFGTKAKLFQKTDIQQTKARRTCEARPKASMIPVVRQSKCNQALGAKLKTSSYPADKDGMKPKTSMIPLISPTGLIQKPNIQLTKVDGTYGSKRETSKKPGIEQKKVDGAFGTKTKNIR